MHGLRSSSHARQPLHIKPALRCSLWQPIRPLCQRVCCCCNYQTRNTERVQGSGASLPALIYADGSRDTVSIDMLPPFELLWAACAALHHALPQPAFLAFSRRLQAPAEGVCRELESRRLREEAIRWSSSTNNKTARTMRGRLRWSCELFSSCSLKQSNHALNV